MTGMTALGKKPESRWQRTLRSLLYGRNVDREVKAKARLGLAIVAFAGIYGVIALRLVTFAVESGEHRNRHTVTQDALATARPDILDRNGAILATDVKAPSLFAEPRKLIDIDDTEEQLTATLPDLDAKEMGERLASKRGFIWLKRDITPKQQHEIHRLGFRLPGGRQSARSWFASALRRRKRRRPLRRAVAARSDSDVCPFRGSTQPVAAQRGPGRRKRPGSADFRSHALASHRTARGV